MSFRDVYIEHTSLEKYDKKRRSKVKEKSITVYVEFKQVKEEDKLMSAQKMSMRSTSVTALTPFVKTLLN